ncbi:MAG TPA: alpha/beta hydrolase [Candidatus Saccharimonadales bacterium]|nr:alpha/beta hydrolase [Candidatus Saccharimonadales bacterium]
MNISFLTTFIISILMLGYLFAGGGGGASHLDLPNTSAQQANDTNTTTILRTTNSTAPVAAAATDTNYAGLEQNTKDFLLDITTKNNPPINSLPPNEARAVLSGLQSSYSVDIPDSKVQNQTIPVGTNNETIAIHIVRPADTSENQVLPVVIYFHGGGWVLGGFDTHERLIKELATNANVSVVYVNYTRSPEAKYPVALEEAYAATKWVAENSQSIYVNSSKLAVAGDSAGGNMATAVAMLAKERGGPAISFQALFYPVTDYNFNTTSYEQFQEGYFLTRDAMKWFWNNYIDNQTTNIRDPLVSPLQASVKQLQGLPPTLVITGENDVLRDEGEAYAHKLMEAGVPVASIRYLGTIHDFMMLNVLANTPASEEAVSQAASIIHEVLYK